MGVTLGIENQHNEALNFLLKAVKIKPNNNFINFNVAKALSESGKDLASIKFHQEAIKLSPQHSEAWLNFGKSLFQLQRYNEAITHYNQAIQLNPNSTEAWFNKAFTLDKLKRYDEAIAHYDQAIQLKVDYTEAWSNKGVILHELQHYDEAIAHYDQAIQLKPDNAETWSNKGLALHHLQRYDEAIIHYDQAIQLKPSFSNAWFNKGFTLHELQHYDEAIAHYDQAIQLKPDNAETWYNKGLALHELQRYGEALTHYDHAIQLEPDYPEAWLNKGISLYELKRYDEALTHYDHAIQLKPDYSEAWSNKAVLKLSLKEFKEGFFFYQKRAIEKNTINLKFTNNKNNLPIWDGEKSCKNLLVIGEQGLGDQIFFSRLLNNLNYTFFNSVTMIASDRLIPILTRSFPKISFIGATKNVDASIYDYKIPLGSLFHALKISHDEIEACNKPYLKDNTDQTKSIMDLPIFKKKLTCGFSWKSMNPKYGQDKSISINNLKEILNIPNLEFINLQYGDVSSDLDNIKNLSNKNLNCIDEIDNFSNIDGLLSVIKSCDVVVTVSNVTAHLAGAVGKKTFLLLPFSRGRIWYWHDQKNSLWYPEIYQYFQDSNMSWKLATQEIAKELKGEKIVRKN
jgi:tetratricopeptide (TPR) repeat protein